MENWIIFWMAIAAIFALAIVGCVVEKVWLWLFKPSVNSQLREEFYHEAPRGRQ